MVVSSGPAPSGHRVTPWHFVRLKLRLTANGFRGQPWRVVIFVLGALYAAFLAFGGYLLSASPGLFGEVRAAGVLATVGGTVLVLGWLILPLLFFGVDESLDSSRFALLPLGRRTVIVGLLAGAMSGIPALAMVIGTAGMVHSAVLLGGWFAGVAALVGVLLGLLLCVSLSRAVTSAFATGLRSRRARDLAGVVMALLFMLVFPLQLVADGFSSTDDDRVDAAVRVLGWLPLGAPWTLGQEVVEGRVWAVPVKLAITVATVAALLWWWSRSLESAMLGTVGRAHHKARPAMAGGPVARLFPRLLPGLPRTRLGALIAREVRYWWREARRRAGLLAFAVLGVFLLVTGGPVGGSSTAGETRSLAVTSGLMLFLGIFAAMNLANQFGPEGSAYAANVIAGVPGRTEMHARALGYSAYVVPIFVVLAGVSGVLAKQLSGIPALLGALIAGYGAGLALELPISVLGAYAMPNTANPFAMPSGSGMAKGLLSIVVMLGAGIGSLPIVAAAFLLGDAWVWLGLPLGLAYAALGYWIGVRWAGAALDRRMPELLATISSKQ